MSVVATRRPAAEGRRTRLRTARAAAGFSMRGLARALPYNHPAVSRIERGLMEPSRPFRRRAAELLELPEEWLFEDAR